MVKKRQLLDTSGNKSRRLRLLRSVVIEFLALILQMVRRTWNKIQSFCDLNAKKKRLAFNQGELKGNHRFISRTVFAYPHSAPHVALFIFIYIRTEADEGIPPIVCLDQRTDWLFHPIQRLAAGTAK